MRIGYPCINRGIGCSGNRTFRLASWSRERFLETVQGNLDCLSRILAWNRDHGILFFRVTSDLVPFASHPVCTEPWQEYFSPVFASVGEFIRESGIRISMHPDQFIVLNSPDPGIVSRSIAELEYHADVLDCMGLDSRAKIQLHVGGTYGDPGAGMDRFIAAWQVLDPRVQRRLVIENDDRRFGVADCLYIHEQTGIPVLFDVFHHACYNLGEEAREMLRKAGDTWRERDGIPMVDYSSQHPEKRAGGHADHIDTRNFKEFLALSDPLDMDIMLEIKDKEKSALEAVSLARKDPRYVSSPG